MTPYPIPILYLIAIFATLADISLQIGAVTYWNLQINSVNQTYKLILKPDT